MVYQRLEKRGLGVWTGRYDIPRWGLKPLKLCNKQWDLNRIFFTGKKNEFLQNPKDAKLQLNDSGTRRRRRIFKRELSTPVRHW